MQAGAPIEIFEWPLPDEAKTSAPRERSVFTAEAIASVNEAAESHAPLKSVSEPRLRLTALTSGWLAMIQLSPEITWEISSRPEASITFTLTSLAAGAMPTGATVP